MSDIQAHLSDGTILQFPAGTTDDVVNSTVKSHLGMDNPNDPLAGIENPVNDALSKGFSFAATAATKAAGGLGDLITKGPQGMLRNALFPEVAEAERNVGAQPAPGSTLAQKALDAGGYEFKPESGGSSIGLSAATGAAAGAPFGPAGMAIGGAGGALSEGANQMGLPRYAQVAAGLAPAFLGKPASMASNLFRKPETQAASLIRSRLESDAAAGGPSPQSMGLDLSGSGNAPLTLADVGGEGVKGLAEKVATQPGEARQVASQFLNDRDAAAGTRLMGETVNGLSSGKTAFDTAQQLQQQRAQAAAPAYQAAGIPSDPAQYPKAPTIDTPAVTRLLDKSKDVQSAINSARGLPDYADLPSNSIVMLDKAYKNVGGDAQAAKVAGNGERARDLNSLRMQLKDAITGGDPNHPYQQALDAYSGPSQSIGALEEGQKIYTKSPEQIAEDMKGLSDGDKDFYRIGAADALRNKITSTSSGGNEALKIVGNEQLQQKFRPLFPDYGAYSDFIKSAQNENRMFQTRQQMLGNSRTAARLAEAQASEGSGFMGPAVQGAMGLISHEPVLGIGSLLRGVGNAYQKLAGPSPATNAAAARMLFNPAISQQQLQQIISSRLGQRFPLSPGLTATSMLNPPANNGPLAGQ